MNHEEVSALVDGEVGGGESGAIITGLGGDRAARGAWHRYHLIGDVLRDGGSAARPVSAAPVVLAPRGRSLPTPLTGLAIAASVAALAVVLVAGRGGDVSAPGLEVAGRDVAAPASAAPAAATLAGGRGEPAAVADPPQHDPARRLDGYLVNFNEQRARLGVPGVHPYVRIVGFESP